MRPKVHFASPRTAFNVLTAPEPGGPRRLLAAPRWTQHADYVNPFEFVDWLRRARAFGLPDFDIMLEARGRDLALLRLRADLEQLPQTYEAGSKARGPITRRYPCLFRAQPGRFTAPGHQRALVAVLPTPADLTRAAEEGWYRVPVARASAQMGADYLAFYQTGAFAPADRWQIATLAAVRRQHRPPRGLLPASRSTRVRTTNTTASSWGRCGACRNRSPAGACVASPSSPPRSRGCSARAKSTICGTREPRRTACGAPS
ncbi:MAG: hypothetical protein IPM84_15000 [Anaerolineae bacterium]|nr:hypothetical protein [Anaerolineae bacterium]